MVTQITRSAHVDVCRWLELMASIKSDARDVVADGVRQATARRARSFGDWVQRPASAFR
jgi:hypothetical protein